MIDIHTHVLPGIDDGPATMEQALQLLGACVADGINHVVVTPHIYPGRYDNTRISIEASFSKLLSEIKKEGLPLTLSMAAEVRLSETVPDLLMSGQLPFLGSYRGNRLVLLEMPDGQIPVATLDLVHWLRRNGVRVVLAHPERNRMIIAKPERIEPLFDAGCLIQITAASLLGQFGPDVLSASRFMLDTGLVSAVASDCHNLHGRRPRMSEAQEWLLAEYGESVALQLTYKGPAMLCGIALPKLSQ